MYFFVRVCVQQVGKPVAGLTTEPPGLSLFQGEGGDRRRGSLKFVVLRLLHGVRLGREEARIGDRHGRSSRVDHGVCREMVAENQQVTIGNICIYIENTHTHTPISRCL